MIFGEGGPSRIEAEQKPVRGAAVDRAVRCQDHRIENRLELPPELAREPKLGMMGDGVRLGVVVEQRAIVAGAPDEAVVIDDHGSRDASKRLFAQRRSADGAFVFGLTRFQIGDEEMPVREGDPEQFSSRRQQVNNPLPRYRDTEIFVRSERLARLRVPHPGPRCALSCRIETVEVAACITGVALENVASPGLDRPHGEQRRSDIDRSVVTSGETVEDALFTGKKPERIHVSPLRVELKKLGARSRRAPVQKAVASDGE